MADAGQRVAILVALLGVAICAGMAAFGFKGRISVVGVDLGTTFSVVAVNEHGVVRVINDTSGDPLVPSVVSFAPKGRIEVGKAARQRLAIDPRNTIYNAKRFIGRDFSDPTVKIEAMRHPYKVLEHPGNYTGIGFSLDVPGHPSVVTPEDIGSRVLLHLLDMVADYLGHRQVTKAVIAVPAKFDARQKRATAEAYRKAGLKVMRVLEEPTAAAIAYGLHQKPEVHHILVYDFGGGTLDVSLLYVHNGFVTVSAIDGDEHLGGSDFDHCLSEYLMSKHGDFTSDAGPHSGLLAFDDDDDEKHKGPSGTPVRPHAARSCSSYTMLAIAEHMKRALSFADTTDFECVHGPSRELLRMSVTREEFEEACRDIFKRALAPVDGVLESNSMKPSEVDEVVLVGGTTRIPLVREMLKQHLNVSSLNTHIDPDVTVAFGAASVID